MFANGNRLGDAVINRRQLDPGVYPTTMNAAFFADPPLYFDNSGQAVGGLFNVGTPLGAGPWQEMVPNSIGVQEGAAAGGALVVEANVVDIVIPCYWNGGYGAETCSHIHFEARVEALSGQATTTTAGQTTLGAVGATFSLPVASAAQAPPALIGQNIRVAGHAVVLKQINASPNDSADQITVQNMIPENVGVAVPTGATVVFPLQWTQLTNAALDIYAAAYDTPNNGYTPPQGVPDTIVTFANDAYNVSPPQGFPATVFAPEGEGGRGVWSFPVVLPQTVDSLRIAVYAALYSTPEDWAEVGGLAGAPAGEFPSVAYYADQLGLPDTESRQNEISTITAHPPPDPAGAGRIASEPGDTHLWDYSPTFTIGIAPTAFLPAGYMVYTVMYMPPGDQSSVAFQTSESYSTSVSYQLNGQNTTTATSVTSDQLTLGTKTVSYFGIDLSDLKDAAGITFSSGFTATETVQGTTQFQEQFTQSATATWGLGSCGKGWTVTNPPPPGDALTSVWQEPFWQDTIVVLPSPIFAVWNAPPIGGAQALSAVQVLGFANQGAIDPIALQVSDLYCHVLSNSRLYVFFPDFVFELSPQDCAVLLNLDPFFAGATWNYGAGAPTMWQGEQPDLVDPSRFVRYLIGNSTTLPAGKPLPGSLTATVAQQLQAEQIANSSASSQASTTTAINLGTVVSASQQNQQQTTVAMTYQSQVTQNASTSVESCFTLLDSGGLNFVEVYYDALYGGFCFWDPNQPQPTSSPAELGMPPFCVAPSNPVLGGILGGHLPPRPTLPLPRPPFDPEPPRIAPIHHQQGSGWLERLPSQSARAQ